MRHHATNVVNTWETMNALYSSLGLWKQLPTTKLAAANETGRNVLVFLSAKFDHVVPESESIAAVFHTPAFAQEPKLTSAIREYDEAIVLAREKGEKRLYHLLRPSMLPRYGWV